ncbi:histidine kinase [Nocardioides gansuensis]|uniref:histidine kinase n=1 Tax=Nocardioides gansuensis TaxID=2138300 RepID=A0A2T8F8T2_9ACTN|nr:sensor histidine kinase [Nocardioides gansuensis]PVG82077.1 histidine kinase [Nocardioides gansuensis]
MGRSREGSVARQVLLLQVLVVLLVVGAALGLAAYDARQDARDSAVDTAVSVAQAVADSPAVHAALKSPDPSAELQPYAERVRKDTDVDFVVVMGLDRTRYTHTNPAQIGKPFIGDLGGAPEGKVFTQEYTGTLGPSMRAVVPVIDDGAVVALVSVGITVDRIDAELRRALLPLALAGAVVLGVGLLGALLISRRLRRQTHGLGEAELGRMFEYHQAVLHAVREGLLLLDDQDRVQLVNDEARRLLDLPDDVVGRPVAELGLPPALVRTAVGETAEADDVYVTGNHVLVVSSSPARWKGREVGAVVTLRDRTELQAVTGELDVVRGLTEALRAQNHESANRLHTVVSLIEMGRPDEAVDFATEELQVAQLLTDRVVGAVDDPVLAALLLGKSAEAAERGIVLSVDGAVAPDPLPVEPRDLVTIAGNLVDNALDAVAGGEGARVEVAVEWDADHLSLRVGDNGPGIDPADREHVLERGWSTKAGGGAGRGVGLALVAQVARRHGGTVRIGSSALGGAEVEVCLTGDRGGRP